MREPDQLGIAPPGVYDIILEALQPVRGLRILDVPCASGGFARRLASQGAVGVAADLVPAMGHRPAVLADMNRLLPFADRSFDAITCIEGIEHIHDPFHVVREFHRLLRPAGRLILSTPNIHNLRSRIKFLLRGTLFWFDPREIHGVGHVNVVPYFILKHILSVSGFTDVSVRFNRTIAPCLPPPLCRLMQRVFSGSTESVRELNAPVLLNGEGLIVFARKS